MKYKQKFSVLYFEDRPISVIGVDEEGYDDIVHIIKYDDVSDEIDILNKLYNLSDNGIILKNYERDFNLSEVEVRHFCEFLDINGLSKWFSHEIVEKEIIFGNKIKEIKK